MKKYRLTDYVVHEYNSKKEYTEQKESELLTLNKDKSITVYSRYRTKNGKFKTVIENI